MFVQNWKLRKIKKIYNFLKNYAGIDSKHPQTIGSTRERRIWRSRALHLQRKTRHHSGSSNGCSSHRPQSVAYWGLPLVEFSMPEKCKSPICWDNSDKKTVLWVMTMIWIPLQCLVEKCKTEIFQSVWNYGSASGNHVTVGSPASIRWPWLHAVEKFHQYICPGFDISPPWRVEWH